VFIRVPFPNQRLYHLPIILGALALTAFLAYRLSPAQAQRLLGLLLVGGMALVFLRWPPLGLAALILTALIVPFAIGTGTQTSLNAVVLLLPLLTGLWLFDMIVRQRRLALHPSRPILPLLGLALTAILAFLAGQLPWFPTASAPLRAQLGGLAIYLLAVAAFLLAAHQIPNIRWLQRLTWLFLALGGLYIAGRLIPGLGRITWRIFQPGSTGSLFWIWLVALAFAQALFNRELGRAWRWLLFTLILAAFYIGFFQARAWASGWLPPLIAVIAIFWAAAPRLGLPATLFGIGVVALNLQRVLDAILLGDNQYSYVTRLAAWRILAEIVRANPLLGLGPANYYWYTPLFPILGWYVSFNSHNQYVDLIAQTGLLGLFFYLWFFWEMLRLAWRLRTTVSPCGFAQAYVYGVFGGLVGTLAAGALADWVLPFPYNIGLTGFRASVLGWLFMGGLAVVETTKNTKNTKGKNSSSCPL